jgi:hypothetical protein
VNKWLGVVAFVLSLLGLFWTAATKWQALTDDVAGLHERLDYQFGVQLKGSK